VWPRKNIVILSEPVDKIVILSERDQACEERESNDPDTALWNDGAWRRFNHAISLAAVQDCHGLLMQ